MPPPTASIQHYLVTTPLEILVALLRLLTFVIIAPIAVLTRLVESLCELFRTRTLFPEEPIRRCPSLPEGIVRRPDPCLYSQAALHAQGLPFTMVNPDVWYFDAAAPTELNPPIEPDHDYVVQVRVHNASTDAAIGVRVGVAAFRGAAFAFIGPELVPLRDIDVRGPEHFRFVDVGPLSSTVASFDWRTPPANTEPLSGLRVQLSHPMDLNPDNNLGIHSFVAGSSNPGHVAPGSAVDLELPLHNLFRTTTRFRIEANTYAVDTTDRVQLKLVKTVGRSRRPLSARLANIQPRIEPLRADAEGTTERRGTRGTFSAVVRPRVQVVRARYEGFDDLRKRILSRDYSLPPGMTVTTPGVDDVRGLTLEPGERRQLHVRITVPADAPRGTTIPVNLVTLTSSDVLYGAITVLLTIPGVE